MTVHCFIDSVLCISIDTFILHDFCNYSEVSSSFGLYAGNTPFSCISLHFPGTEMYAGLLSVIIIPLAIPLALRTVVLLLP